jgi:TonB family protein
VPDQSDKRPPPETEEVGLIPVFTLVVWTGCVLVTVIDLLLGPQRAPPPATQPALTVETLNVDITSDDSQIALSTDSRQADTPQEVPAPDDTPLAMDIAAPDSSLAFEQPMDAPATAAKPLHPAMAVPLSATAHPAAAPSGHVQHLTFGLGAGAQPAPDYPREAVLDNQQGTVRVQFTVGENGRVQSAEITVPSPWPILNQAALRAVRDTWIFPTAPPRLYDIEIEFSLQP